MEYAPLTPGERRSLADSLYYSFGSNEGRASSGLRGRLRADLRRFDSDEDHRPREHCVWVTAALKVSTLSEEERWMLQQLLAEDEL